MVPLNMSSLLTTTNIRIVIAVLRVVGEKGTQMVTQRIGYFANYLGKSNKLEWQLLC